MRHLKYIILFIFSWMIIAWCPVHGQKAEMWLKGVAAVERRSYREAADIFEKTAVSDGNEVKILLLRGEANMLAGDYERALESFYLAEQRSPGISSVWIARTYTLAGDQQKAFQWLKTHLQSGRRLPMRTILLDTVFSRLENTPGWRELWKHNWYTEREKEIAEAEFLILRGSLHEALRKVSDLTARYGEDPGLLRLRGRIYLRMGKHREAIQDLRKVISGHPADTAALGLLARAWTLSRNYPEAAAALTAFLRVAPERFDVLLTRAGLLAENGQYEQAMSDLQRYLYYFPESTETMFKLGSYSAAAGKYTDAMRYFTRVINREQGNPVFFVARAEVYMKTRTYRYAIQDYGMALDLDPTNGDVYFNRAEALLKTGRKKEACFDFGQALHYGKKESVSYLRKYCGY